MINRKKNYRRWKGSIQDHCPKQIVFYSPFKRITLKPLFKYRGSGAI